MPIDRQFAKSLTFHRQPVLEIGGANPEAFEKFAAIEFDGRAPRGRELPVREGLTRIIVDWSGSWQAARPGNWLGRSPATKAALGR